MAGVKVDPPPVAMSIVDPKTGMPTRPFIEFIHRLWQRTGGEKDAVEDLGVTNAYPFFRTLARNEQEDNVNPLAFPDSGAKTEEIEQAANRLYALMASRPYETDLYNAVESLRAVTLSSVSTLRSEIGELRNEVEHLQKTVYTNFLATHAVDKKVK